MHLFFNTKTAIFAAANPWSAESNPFIFFNLIVPSEKTCSGLEHPAVESAKADQIH